MSLMLGVSCHQAWRISYIMIKLKKIIKLYKSWIIKLNLKKKNFLTITYNSLIFKNTFKLCYPKWDKFLALDYPTADSYRKFNERKAQGLIPASARIGGSVGIHGTWPKEEFAVDAHQNWTLGCVSTKNDFIREIYNQLPVGTRVEIVK
jgi:hypothetical protein